MEINTILIISTILIQVIIELRRSRCTDIEISDCLKIHREIQRDNEETL
jgi:hypothetical protein